jgi:CMP-N,N'-diacetyllegionaminic acid synthase
MITAIVPARSGSKRLPGKNIKELSGRPLIFHTIDAVLNQKAISKVIFSTDSNDYIKRVRSEYGDRVVIEKRPDAFASDTTKVHEEVIRLCDSQIVSTEWFMLCLPTAPLRNNETVARFLRAWDADRNARFTASPYDFPIQFGFEIDVDGDWQPLIDESPMVTGNTRSQDIPTRYRPNGAIYLNTVQSLKINKTFYIGAKPFLISRIESTDVDTEFDFITAELLISEKNNV